MTKKNRILAVVVSTLLMFVFIGGASAQPTASDIARLLEGRGIYFDSLGLIVHKDAQGNIDGGDTAQREGWYWLGVWIRQNAPGFAPWGPKRTLNFDQVLRLLEPNGDGVFYRHPSQPPFNNPRDKRFGFSRDQMEPLVAAMGVWGKTTELQRLWDALPEDLLGKHAFNGNWRNFLGQDGPNCADVLRRGCDATADCSLKVDTRDCSLSVDTRDCSLQVDNRDCSLQVDNRDCSLQVDTRSCGHDINLPFNGRIHINDPICETAKGAQNAAYAAQKAACEVSKTAQNGAYASQKGTCEAAKTSQNAAYAAAKGTCEAGKVAQNAAYAAAKGKCEAEKGFQNAAYAAEKFGCETGKTTGKYACEVQKQADYQLCRLSNVHSGDLIGPMTVNLFRRALNQIPLMLPGDATFPAGEAELLVNAHLRVGAARDRDDVGDDLNLIVKLLLAKLRYPTTVSDEASRVYATQRPHSYGSYLKAYYATYGSDMTDIKNRMNAGIASGWPTDVSAPYGAVRWYHRPDTGANPQLAELYSVIIDRFIK